MHTYYKPIATALYVLFSTVFKIVTFEINITATPVEYRSNVGFTDKKQEHASFTIHVTSGPLFGIHDLDLAFFIKWDE